MLLLIEGAPSVGDHVDDDNLFLKGRPFIMRFIMIESANNKEC